MALGAVVEPNTTVVELNTTAVDSRTLVVGSCCPELPTPLLGPKDRLPDTDLGIVWLNIVPELPRPSPETRFKLLMIE